MLLAYYREPSGSISVQSVMPEAGVLEAPGLVWLDLVQPTPEEEACLEAFLGMEALTSAERSALEESSRFYEEGDAIVLTATLMAPRDSSGFCSEPVTFIVKGPLLVTVRDIRPKAFEIGQGRASARIDRAAGAADILHALIESVIERIADRLQNAGRDANALSSRIFESSGAGPPNLSAELRELGRIGAVVALCHDSAASLQRLAGFAEQVGARHGLVAERFRALRKDSEQLERQAEALQNTLNFQLDAILGVVGAAQNNVLKTLSVATVAFVPPTLVASIFGMNFEAMTWFQAGWGPYAAFGIMVGAVVAVFVFAKAHRWL